MVNFKKLKQLISQFEHSREIEKRQFFLSLKKVAEQELNTKQLGLLEFW